MPHFFIDSKTVINSKITISDKGNYNHIAKSLRAKAGEDILLIDENGIQYSGEIEKITSNSIEIAVLDSWKSTRELEFELYLAQSPLRSDAQNLIVEKATEIGVAGIYPILTDNCALKKSVIEQKIQKWQKIMHEASKQCERAKIPKCFELSDMEKLINLQSKQNFEREGRVGLLTHRQEADNALIATIDAPQQFDRVLAFTERSAKFKLKNYLKDNPIVKNEKILVIIGPEGGFSQREFDFFEKNDITTLSLGNLILKAETAVVTALGNIVYEYE